MISGYVGDVKREDSRRTPRFLACEGTQETSILQVLNLRTSKVFSWRDLVNRCINRSRAPESNLGERERFMTY